MRRAIRRILFYIFIVIFVVLGVAVTMYAQGWRLDPNEWKFGKVGAIYVVPLPAKASIYLDGEKVKKNGGIFQRGTLINNVLPHNHTLEISLSGYKPWKRTVLVEPSKVTEIPRAVLVPETSTVATEQGIKNFWIVDGGNILVEQKNGKMILSETPLQATAPQEWNRSRTAFLSIDPVSKYPVLVNIKDATSTPLRALLATAGVKTITAKTRIQIDDGKDTGVFVIGTSTITMIDARAKTVSPIATNSTGTLGQVASTRTKIAWTVFSEKENTSELFIYDRLLQRINATSMSFPKKSKNIKWDTSYVAILQENGALYLFSGDQGKTNRQAENVRDFFISEHGKKLAVLGSQSMEIFSFDSDSYARFNLKDISDVSSIEWHRDDNNLFIHYSDKVVLFDIGDGLQENITTVADIASGAYYSEDSSFYFLDGESVRMMTFLED